ncbi:peptidoglycan-binding domain-containing protein [Methylosinus sp. Ce-a6]|uniref:peptidoglycan-binding domain-containing protein n=1 Tax=Methylosinus sp. Ce-a6 TaxID=2172005 RepID=UPI001FCE5EFA|nr:peptidoglycan-binding domain-containing protein [Methylosinus sp. Ce-a6]
MREALAATNHDFLLRDEDRGESQRRGRGAKDKVKAKNGALTKLFGGRRRGIVFLSLAGAAAIGVPLNALYFQDGRHPAPLFHSFAPEPRAQAPTPLPPARPQAVAATPVQPQAAQPASAPHAPAMARSVLKPEPAPAEKRDAIGALIGKEAHKDAPKTDGTDKNVMNIQRALAKLGYALHADGKMGGATRQAIEKFERDNRLPVTGEVTPKLLRKLQGQASVAAH